eukprot:1439904-Karenia_brevis.AAC.1
MYWDGHGKYVGMDTDICWNGHSEGQGPGPIPGGEGGDDGEDHEGDEGGEGGESGEGGEGVEGGQVCSCKKVQ